MSEELAEGGLAADEEEVVIRMLRRKVADAAMRIQAVNEERDKLRERDNELRMEIQAIEASVKQTRDILKALVPPKSADEMREEIENVVYSILCDIAVTADPEVAVSRLMPMIPNHIHEDYDGKGLEARVRKALASLQDRGLVHSRKVDTAQGRSAQIWSKATST